MDERHRIMVVDDDRDILTMLNHILDLEGFDAVVIDDGDEALDMLGDVSPDLVILDVAMPGRDGFQTLNSIREQSDVPVIMLSANHEIKSLKHALHLGADDYIRKPFNAKALTARIQAKLRRARGEVVQASG